jgi:glycine betaine/proline transport system permease protein
VSADAALARANPASWSRGRTILALALLIVLAGVGLAAVLPWTVRLPDEWVVPLKLWITAFFKWLGSGLDFGLFTFRDLTRGLSWLLSWPLVWTEALLHKGYLALGLAQLPWPAIVLGVGILGHWIGGWRLALLGGLGFHYLALFGVWTEAMQTLSIVIVAVPLAALLGLTLGIAATRSRRVESVVTVMFDVMQATPHLAYLGPIVVLFGFGQVPAMLATVAFALPPMARCTILGIRTVPAEVVESGRMSGCTPRQLLWKVQLPAAHQTLMVGLNQVIMQTLAMAVIASLVGAPGLGQKLLFSLQQLRLGQAIEQGVAIVVIAVVLDRLSQGYAYRKPPARLVDAPFWQRHAHSLLFLCILAASLLGALLLPELRKLPKELTITTAPMWDQAIRWISLHLFDYLAFIRDGLTVNVLVPLRNGFLAVPWSIVVALVGLLGFHLGGWRLALLTAGLIGTILLTGFWVPAVMTVYLVSVSVLICMALGIPLGIWAARSPRVARGVLLVCDTLQTFPSFIYLIPVVMLFRVGDVASIIAIIGYAAVPSVRFTYLGLRRVPPATVEAARAIGCSARQLLWKVELPIAFPEIMLGVNQTIMMALAMTAITALIGSRDLGQEILKALPEVDTGRGVLAGLSIAFIGITADRLIGAWSRRRKAQLGMA